MKRNASAIWNGDLASGAGTISTPSGVLDDARYSFRTRFEDGVNGTNPEELIAAAHAGCFSMALSHELAQAGHDPKSVSTKATVQLDEADGGFAITRIHLDADAHVPGIDQAEFDRIAEGAKEGCPVSKVLDAEIELDIRLNA
ncbi:OsmC family peroxiredoxin [Maritimibacter sp. 55A14]|uniref:OsmC family protein n=1 Tax=Maritimibacter sp. 55A14 TaxID=2174844 RepID=UPI000D603789|nr:OsmC family protein [Maritimibacter sp. 55A14]PWE32081.1 OsmC family peroxiredoxin [Maritimibacter sp. 55A14]